MSTTRRSGSEARISEDDVAAPSAARIATSTVHAPGVALRPALVGVALGGLGLVLGGVGVYGVVSYFVARRRRDWGIRIALGMRPSRVIVRMVGGGGVLVSAGIALDLMAFLALAGFIGSFLYGVDTADIVGMGAATAVLLVSGLLAAYIPARRAGRIDPVLVLRED